MPVPSNPQDLINIIREKLFNNTSGLIEEPDLREVLENIVKVLDAKFSMFSPNLTEEQFAKWNLILDYMLRETKGVLTTSSSAPTGNAAIGKYLLSGAGTFTNLGGLVAAADKLNYAYFDGTNWRLISVDINSDAVNNLTSTSTTAKLSANMGRVLDEKKADKDDFNLYNLIKTNNFNLGTSSVTTTGGDVIDGAYYWTSKNHLVDRNSIFNKIKVRTKTDGLPKARTEIFGAYYDIATNTIIRVTDIYHFTPSSAGGIEELYFEEGEITIPKGAYAFIKGRPSILYTGLGGDIIYGTNGIVLNNQTLTFELLGYETTRIPYATNEELYNILKEDDLSSVSFSILGDSVSTYTGINGVTNPYYPNGDVNSIAKTWWGYLLQKGASLCYNNSIGGTKITNKSSSDMPNRIGGLKSSGTTGNSPNLIILFGGINDIISNTQIPIGAISDGFTDNTTKFISAYGWILENLRTTYPNAKIICIIPYQMNGYGISGNIPTNSFGVKVSDFYDAIRSVTNLFQIPIVDLPKLIDAKDSSLKFDGIHPKASLQKLIAKCIIEEIKRNI